MKTDTLAKSGNNSELRGMTRMMKRIHNTKRTARRKNIAIILAVTAFMTITLVACGNKTETPNTNTGSELQGQALANQNEAQAERDAFIEDISSRDILANAGAMTQVKSLASDYPDVPTQYLSEMKAWESSSFDASATGEDDIAPIPSYVFIGRIADKAHTQEITKGLLSSVLKLHAVEENGDSYDCSTAVQGDFVICAASPNGTEIVNKFVVLVGDADAESDLSIDELFSNLSKSISE